MSFLALLTLILVYSLQKRILTTMSVYSDTLKTYSDTKFRQVVGFPRDIFNQMVELVEVDYRQVHTRSKQFHLPGAKKLLNEDSPFEIVLVDATDTRIERPKKSRNKITRESVKRTQ